MFFRPFQLPEQRPLPGEGRLRLVATCFWLMGSFGLLGASLGAVYALTNPPLGGVPKAVGWMYIGLAAAMSLALFRTAHLVRARTRMGAWLAAGTILCLWLPALHGSRVSVFSFILGGIGILLIASVWKYLD